MDLGDASELDHTDKVPVPTTDHRPPTTDHRPPTIDHLPPTTDYERVTADRVRYGVPMTNEPPLFFELYDLRVEVIAPAGARILCGAKPGDWFELRGEMLHLPPNQGFSIYSLAALMLLLPAKQRVLDPNDWMDSDSDIACPDPHCPSLFRITRLGKRRFERSATTATPAPAARK
jgi:uncharacterized repeat protein (TIGR04076 family)